MMRIAIVKLSAMGDIIHAVVALEFIKKALPDIRIDWVVEEAFAKLLHDNPYIDNILTLNLKSLKKKKSLIFKEIKKIKQYKKNNYDLIIDAQGLLKSAIVSKLLGKKIAGFDKDSAREGLSAFFYTDKYKIAYDINKIDRNALLFSKALNIEITQDDILSKKPILFFKDHSFELLSCRKKNILLVISSSQENKNYPKEKFANITKQLDGNFIIIWANENEKNMAKFIKNENEKVVVAPKMSLDELKCLVSKVDLVIGNDTGPTHMAWALNIPSITIFGSTPILQTYQTEINKVIKSSSNVNPSKLDRNDFSICEIDEEEIITLADSVLNPDYTKEHFI